MVCVVLFDITAVAVNCDESPGLADEEGAVTVIDVTVGAAGVVGVVGVLAPPPPQRVRPTAIAAAVSRTRTRRPMRVLLQILYRLPGTRRRMRRTKERVN